MAAPLRELDVAPLTNGLAAIVLQRELERIEAFEVEANERARLNAVAPWTRPASATGSPPRRRRGKRPCRSRPPPRRQRLAREREEAERQAKLRAEQEAERVAKLRAQQEAERQARLREREEAERQLRARQQAESDHPGTETPVRSPPMRPPIGAPLDIRPPASIVR